MTREEFINFAQENNFKLVCADMNGENIFEFKCDDLIGVVVGNEGQGVSDEIANLCFKTVKIPMKDGVDSLNVAAASAVAFWQLQYTI